MEKKLTVEDLKLIRGSQKGAEVEAGGGEDVEINNSKTKTDPIKSKSDNPK